MLNLKREALSWAARSRIRHWVGGGRAETKCVLMRVSMVAMVARLERPENSVWKRAQAIGAKIELVKVVKDESPSMCSRGQLIRRERTRPARDEPAGKSLGREQICMSAKRAGGIEGGKR